MKSSRSALLLVFSLSLLAPVVQAQDEAPASGQRVFLAASGGGGYVSRSAPGLDGQATEASVGLLATAYLSGPLTEDGAPYSLWPYLQRADSLSVSGSFQLVDQKDTLRGGTDAVSSKSGGASVGLDLHLLNWLALFAEVSTALSTEGRQWTSLSGGAGVGLRAGTFRFDAGYGQSGLWHDGTVSHLDWGRVFGRLRWVVKRGTDIQVIACTAPAGGSLEASIEWFLLRSLGIFARAGVGSAQFGLLDGDRKHYERLFGQVGASYWITKRFGLGASYRLFRSRQDDVGFEALAHEGSLTVFGRP